ncbi:hypothetical protein GLOIN_2v1785275 [Rhizophagus irregularis DAOM 181602=DAOM 197198]|uniref:C2H2-type domain-containing protein n=2 Tax=Rhizophagus irregularis TaxID=588596 RepID=A0A2P4PAM4_RHIID|nr:hypothetical protein GLOIN_2v1785275 [Rhizophagus irregularis DAOM 181602=DAOM 197198]POG62434.1 hypothetical protein GLOIN_2v1785275 [Rhizophagus irregularis DAOM 181602=DAOM 197198]|eukprot:XP_025169300.1 hypothetical protein GLOIN_2v1785275 [Rhizophagus irregularis DAOM 181602=DAOM 197198]
MVRYKCQICKRYFSTPSSLRQHANAKHHERTTTSRPSEPNVYKRLDDALDAIEGKNLPEHVAKWPNDAYRDFMRLIVEGNISNKIGDQIIKFFNKYSNLEESSLPKSTKNGKDHLNQITSPSLDFKEKVVSTYSGIDITLYYRPIFCAIQALLQLPEVANNFVYKEILKKKRDDGSETRVFGHPVFLTLENVPNWVQNLPEFKILLGFLPKVQDSGIKTTEVFRSLQREIFHKCFNIMLWPLLEKPDTLCFGINGQAKTFAARISFFLANMLEADDVTATYKGARCKMPCHTCMVLQNNLNDIKLTREDILFRTHENMKEMVSAGQGKEYSVHYVKNAFWEFPNLNIYEACVPDRMHHIDLGLFKYQLEFTQEILKKVGGLELQKIFDERL